MLHEPGGTIPLKKQEDTREVSAAYRAHIVSTTCCRYSLLLQHDQETIACKPLVPMSFAAAILPP